MDDTAGALFRQENCGCERRRITKVSKYLLEMITLSIFTCKMSYGRNKVKLNNIEHFRWFIYVVVFPEFFCCYLVIRQRVFFAVSPLKMTSLRVITKMCVYYYCYY